MSLSDPTARPVLKTPKEWEGITGYRVLDPDGWREDGVSVLTPISLADFNDKAARSTSSFVINQKITHPPRGVSN